MTTSVNAVNSQDEDLKVDMRVITSKGRFGIITGFKDDRTAIVRFGDKLYDIFKEELLKASDSTQLEVYYTNNLSNVELDKTIIHIHKRTAIFDISNPLESKAYKECKRLLNTRYPKSNILITLINIL